MLTQQLKFLPQFLTNSISEHITNYCKTLINGDCIDELNFRKGRKPREIQWNLQLHTWWPQERIRRLWRGGRNRRSGFLWVDIGSPHPPLLGCWRKSHDLGLLCIKNIPLFLCPNTYNGNRHQKQLHTNVYSRKCYLVAGFEVSKQWTFFLALIAFRIFWLLEWSETRCFPRWTSLEQP